jgi:hypothetical protein
MPRLELDQAIIPNISMLLQLISLINVGSNIASIYNIKAAKVACKPVKDQKEKNK